MNEHFARVLKLVLDSELTGVSLYCAQLTDDGIRAYDVRAVDVISVDRYNIIVKEIRKPDGLIGMEPRTVAFKLSHVWASEQEMKNYFHILIADAKVKYGV
jgi:hypothetical protein